PAAAAPDVRARHRCGHQGRGAHRLLLGLWRRGGRQGRPHEANRRDVGIVAQGGRGPGGAMSTGQIIVCGTGIVGLAAALGLARDGQKAALLGPRKPPEPAQPDVYFPRVYALSPESRRFLGELGVWDMLDMTRVTPVE